MEEKNDEREELPLERQPLLKRLRFRTKDYIAYGLYLVVGLYVLYSLGSSILSNYRSQQDIKTAQNEIENLKLEKEKLKSLLVYYDTKSYQEIELRRRLLLKKPGETVVALKGNEPLSEFHEESTDEIKKAPWQEWYDYYFMPR